MWPGVNSALQRDVNAFFSLQFSGLSYGVASRGEWLILQPIWGTLLTRSNLESHRIDLKEC